MSQRTIKVGKTEKRVFTKIGEQKKNAFTVIDGLDLQKEEIVKKYHNQFKLLFLGKFFHTGDKARDTVVDRWLVVTRVHPPYLIQNDATVTCTLTCSVLEISKNTYEGKTSTQVVFTDDNCYYAHSGNLNQVSRIEYKKAHAEALAIIEKSLGKF